MKRRKLFGLAVGVSLGIAAAVWQSRATLRNLLPRPLPKGECTWYVAARAAESGWSIHFDTNTDRHARAWWEKITNARKSQTPVVGAVMVLDAWLGNSYGHVGYVEKVNPDGSFEITHANFAKGKEVGQRENVTIYRASCKLTADGVSLADDPALPLRGFLIK